MPRARYFTAAIDGATAAGRGVIEAAADTRGAFAFSAFVDAGAALAFAFAFADAGAALPFVIFDAGTALPLAAFSSGCTERMCGPARRRTGRGPIAFDARSRRSGSTAPGPTTTTCPSVPVTNDVALPSSWMSRI